MADGHTILRQQIARLRELPEALTSGVTTEVAREVKRELVEQIARGVGPDGKAWKPTQAGEQALPDAARDITVDARGSVVVVTLDGVHARHHYGAVRGKVRRPILPLRTLPGAFSRAIEAVIARRFTKTMGGAA